MNRLRQRLTAPRRQTIRSPRRQLEISDVEPTEDDINLPQVYETSIIHPGIHRSVKAIVVPSRSFRDKRDWLSVTSSLELVEVAGIKPSVLPSLIASMLVPEGLENVGYRLKDCVEAAHGRVRRSIESSEIEFGRQVALRELLPFERSPLSQESLAKLVEVSSNAKDGASASLVVTESAEPGHDAVPLLLVSQRDGVVILGSGPGVRRAVQLGLWRRLLKFLEG